MIVCVCPNPAVDLTYEIDALTPGETHRVARVHRRAGGKATNTAAVLAALGEDVTLVAPLGGAAAEVFAGDMRRHGIRLIAVPISGTTRTSVAVAHGDDATVFNETGPSLTAREWDDLVGATQAAASGATAVVLAGSLPGLPPGADYRALVAAAGNDRVLLDTSGAELRTALAAHPAVVSPNLAEARAALEADVGAAAAAGALLAAGAAAALVSNGSDGAVGATRDVVLTARTAAAVSGNPTGAGDALNAAIARGLATLPDGLPDVLRDAVATAAASVAMPTAGEIDLELRGKLLDSVVVEEVRDAARPDG
jgi:tagatose 6-phosphate kinase